MTARHQRWMEREDGSLALTTIDADADAVQDQKPDRSETKRDAEEGQRKERVSPDPMQPTDRYRLVTPFTLHL
jgi:hypothetical protein